MINSLHDCESSFKKSFFYFFKIEKTDMIFLIKSPFFSTLQKNRSDTFLQSLIPFIHKKQI